MRQLSHDWTNNLELGSDANARRALLEESRLELISDSLDHVSGEVESTVKLVSFLGGVAESYARHRLEVALVLTGGESSQHCILLHCPFMQMNRASARLPEHVLGADRSDEQRSMLVRVPVFMETPQ